MVCTRFPLTIKRISIVFAFVNARMYGAAGMTVMGSAFQWNSVIDSLSIDDCSSPGVLGDSMIGAPSVPPALSVRMSGAALSLVEVEFSLSESEYSSERPEECSALGRFTEATVEGLGAEFSAATVEPLRSLGSLWKRVVWLYVSRISVESSAQTSTAETSVAWSQEIGIELCAQMKPLKLL